MAYVEGEVCEANVKITRIRSIQECINTAIAGVAEGANRLEAVNDRLYGEKPKTANEKDGLRAVKEGGICGTLHGMLEVLAEDVKRLHIELDRLNEFV